MATTTKVLLTVMEEGSFSTGKEVKKVYSFTKECFDNFTSPAKPKWSNLKPSEWKKLSIHAKLNLWCERIASESKSKKYEFHIIEDEL